MIRMHEQCLRSISGVLHKSAGRQCDSSEMLTSLEAAGSSKCHLGWASRVGHATDITAHRKPLLSSGYFPSSNFIRKFAIEGLTEALVDELDPAWHIKVRSTDFMPTSLHKQELNAHRLPSSNLDRSAQSCMEAQTAMLPLPILRTQILNWQDLNGARFPVSIHMTAIPRKLASRLRKHLDWKIPQSGFLSTKGCLSRRMGREKV
jgi:hypothetical protein